MTQTQKRNLTISLSPEVIQKARIIAVKRSTSISGLVAEQIEALVSDDDAYQRAAASAIARMKQGLHLGGGPYASRDELHDR
jgi:Family of unknown function (DUF6364)